MKHTIAETKQEIRSILAAVDRDAEAPMMVGKAAALARLTGASLELFHCDAARAYVQRHQYDPSSALVSSEVCAAESRQFLEKLWRSLEIGDIGVTMHAACESPLYEAIVREVRQCRPDLVVRGASASMEGSGAGRALGANDWELVRTCPAPLLLTHGRPWRPQPLFAAAIDVSGEESPTLTTAILRSADFLARRARGKLELIHAGRFDEERPAALESCRDMLAQRAKEAGIDPEAIHVVAGEPATALPAFAARRDYDLIALGALTHRKALTALVGTLTGRLIETLDSDFLLVKSVPVGAAQREESGYEAAARAPAPPH